MNITKISLLALSALSLSAASVQAADYISVNGGYYDALRKDQKAGQFGAEYRLSPIKYGLSPIAGAFVTTKGAGYGYAGLDWALALMSNELYLVPNFAVGAYGKGNGKDLGGVLEFRSGIELDYQFKNSQQIGVALNHLSNAGIYSHNPGEETIMATYSIPVGTLFGGR